MSKGNTNLVDASDFLLQLKSMDEEPSTDSVVVEDIMNGEEPVIIEPSVDNEQGENKENVEETPSEGVTPSNEPSDDVSSTEGSSKKRLSNKDTIETLLESGVWQDVAISYDGVEYDSIRDLVEKEKITKDLLLDLNDVQKQLRDEEISGKYLPISDIDESRRGLIDAIVRGVDYGDLLELDREVVQPTVNFDVDSANIDEVMHFVKQGLLNLDNFPEKYVDAEIESLKNDFRLHSKAKEYKQRILEEYQSEINQRIAQHEEMQRQFIERQEQDIISFSNDLINDGYNENFARMASELRYNIDEQGVPHFIRLLEDRIENPSFAKKLMHLLIDEDDFVNKLTTKTKSETSRRMIAIAKGSSKNSSGMESATVEKNNGEDFFKRIGI